MIIYAVVTGMFPFGGDEIMTAAAIQRGQFWLPADVSEDCGDLIQRILVVSLSC